MNVVVIVPVVTTDDVPSLHVPRGETETMVEADAVSVLHERFVAALIAIWSVDE